MKKQDSIEIQINGKPYDSISSDEADSDSTGDEKNEKNFLMEKFEHDQKSFTHHVSDLLALSRHVFNPPPSLYPAILD